MAWEKQQIMAQVLGILWPNGSLDEAPSFDLTQPWPLELFEESPSEWKIFFLTQTLIP